MLALGYSIPVEVTFGVNSEKSVDLTAQINMLRQSNLRIFGMSLFFWRYVVSLSIRFCVFILFWSACVVLF